MSELSVDERSVYPAVEPIPISVRRASVLSRVSPLARPLTRLVGRHREVAEIQTLLTEPDVRLLVLVGSGGVGKTRLCLRVADLMAQTFADGVVQVALASLTDATMVGDAIASALGIRDAGSEPLEDRLATYLFDREMLLVLDNFEQVAAAAPLIVRLLGTCRRLKGFVTSRARLNVGGEFIYTVPPLSLPQRLDDEPSRQAEPSTDLESDAVRLFVERARAVQSGFSLSSENVRSVELICTRLDGLPLAIELAAARLSHLPVSALLTRLEQRLPLLTGGPREQPERLRTMRAAIDWSYDLLDSDMQALFRQVAVFAGGFTIGAAAAIVDEPHSSLVLDAVAALVDRSLIQVMPEVERPAAGAGPRYVMLETFREFALEQLAASGETETIFERHAQWCHMLAEQALHAFGGPDPHPWSERLEREIANFRVALHWLERRERGEDLLALANTLFPLWRFRGHPREGLGWIIRGLDLSPFGQAELAVSSLNHASLLAAELGDLAGGAVFIERSLERAHAAGDPSSIAHALYIRGVLEREQNRPEEARRCFESSLDELRRLGDQWGAGWALCDLATLGNLGSEKVPADPRDQALALDRCEEALDIFLGIECALGIVRAYHGLAFLEYRKRNYPRALELVHVTLRLRSEKIRDRYSLAASVEDVADIAVMIGQPRVAARLYGAAEAQREAIGAPVGPFYKAEYQREVATVRQILGLTECEAIWNAGRLLSIDDAVAEALAFSIPSTNVTSDSPASPPSMASSLTEREREVLRLVVAGYSNREIADALFISRKTAEHHVTHILGKLGVESRAAAAAVGVRLGFH